MKKTLALLLAASLIAITPVTCPAEEVQGTEAATEEVNPETQEGYTVEGEGYISVVTWCKNGDMNIYGKFYYPDGFDETKEYPTVIMSHGLGSTAKMVERANWPQRAVAEGFVVYTFDFCGGSINSSSDGDYLEMSVLTEESDLNAVMDFVESRDFVDTDHLFLLGQSQGGLVSALTAGQRPEEVKGLILVYPALCIVSDLHDYIEDISEVTGDTVETAMGTLGAVYAKDAYDLDVYAEIGKYDGDVLIIHGENDKTVPISFSEEAIETSYKDNNAELLTIEGEKSLHGFEMVDENLRDQAEDAGMEFLTSHLD